MYRTLTLIVLVAALTGCGDSSNDANLLSRSSAADLRATLSQVQQKVESGDCNGAQDQVSLLEQQIDSLDTNVDSDLRAALVSSATRLQRLVSTACTAATTQTGSTGAAGATDTGGTTGTTGEQGDEENPGKGNGKGKKKGHEKKKKDKIGVEIEPDAGTGGSGSGGGTTDSGGIVP
jgi:hypothetical protein